MWGDDAGFEVVGTDVRDTNMMPPTLNLTSIEAQRRMYAGLPLAPVNMGFEVIR